jgi:hypothetical protein
MQPLALNKAFTLMEPGPVVLVTTRDGAKDNIMTISWTMVLDFTPLFAITTGTWNHSFAALRKHRECVIAIPTVDLLGDSTVADQSGEPYASWGQMLPALFQPSVAVSNQAESGETFRDSLARRRLDKHIRPLNRAARPVGPA